MLSFLKSCFLLCVCHQLQALDLKPVRSNRTESRRTYIEKPPYHTWMGILMSKHSAPLCVDDEYVLQRNSRNCIYNIVVPPIDWRSTSTHIILINDALAVGYAGAISNWNPEADNIKAMFWWADGRTWFCGVEKYKVHPEFDKGRRTLALVYLTVPNPKINWLPIAWPRSNSAPNPTIYIGINHEPGHVFQYWEEVVIYSKHECDSFYIYREGLANFAKIAQYTCYVAPRFKYQRCWYHSGMALVYESHGKMYLFAVSTGGPGCFSPSRWIHFHPFREWIQDNSRPNLRSGNAEQGMYDYYQDLDAKLLSRLHDKNMELHWAWNSVEWLHGNCWFGRDHLMYREKTVLKTKVNGTIATYSISLYDRIYDRYTCVSLLVYCKRKTNTRWWFSKGFQQDDIDYYVRKVPYTIDGNIAPKIIFLMDKYRKYHDIETANIDFQFEFDIEAELDVQFYGHPKPPPETSTSTSTTTTYRPPAPSKYYKPFWGKK